MSDVNLLFVIPLAIGLVAVYVANKFNDEMADLGIIISIVSLILGIIFAPWQLQLCLFVLVIMVARQIWKSNENNSIFQKYTEDIIGKINVTSSPDKNRSVPSKTNGKMIRTYRGVSYTVSVAPESKTRKDIGGTYRGNPWTTKNNQGNIGVLLSPSELKYRGVRWTVEESSEAQERLKS